MKKPWEKTLRETVSRFMQKYHKARRERESHFPPMPAVKPPRDFTERVEYKVISQAAEGPPLGAGENYAERLTDGFNELGRHNWQLVTVVGDYIIFSRKIEGQWCGGPK